MWLRLLITGSGSLKASYPISLLRTELAGRLLSQIELLRKSMWHSSRLTDGSWTLKCALLPQLRQKKFGQSVLCVFIPYTNPFFERVCDAHVSEGRELERCRIRNELHKGVSQQLLGAAFGCKLLAGKVVKLSEELGKEASDLAELLNEAVLELQKLVQSSENQG